MWRIVKSKFLEVVRAFRIFLSFLKYLQKHRSKIIFLMVMLVLTSIFGAITPLLAKFMVDNVIPNRNWTMFWIILFGFLSVSFILQGISIYQNYISRCMNHEVRANLSTMYLRNLLRLPFTEIQQRQAGAQIFRATSDVDSVVNLITTFFTGLAGNFVSLATAVVIMFRLNWKVTFIYIVFVPLVFFLRVYISLKIRPLQKKLREHNESISGFLGQIFSGVKIVKIFGMETFESLKYLRLLRENIRINFRMWTVQTILGRVQWVFESGVGSLLQWWIWFSVMKQYTSLGSAMAISWYFSMIVGPFMSLAGSIQGIIAGMIPGERVFETLSKPKESLYEGRKLYTESNRYCIEFRDVSFSYVDGNKVIKNATFRLKPGTITALVGPSGSGKTTIINLICALYCPCAGCVEINNVPISEVAISSLRDLIALVPQEPFIFEATIMDNIRYSDRYASKEEVIRAAKMADIHKKIMSMPKYYNTVLKQGQDDLSIGEQQRITIARAFLRKSPVMIFDEAFSNLDVETECKIIDSLRRIKGNKTIVIISHRLKSLVFADNIIAIREGYIIESGSPTELIEKEGVFFEWLESSPGQHASSIVL